jgi:hypothetical protein
MRHCIGRLFGASLSARTNCAARDSVSLGMAGRAVREEAIQLMVAWYLLAGPVTARFMGRQGTLDLGEPIA